MKKLAIIFVLLAVAFSASCQTRYDSPQTVAWDSGPDSEAEDVGIRIAGQTEVTIVALDVVAGEQIIDLEALGLFGVFEVVVRGVVYTPPDERDETVWVGSLNPDAVLEIDGQPHTFLIRRKRPAESGALPGALRIQ